MFDKSVRHIYLGIAFVFILLLLLATQMFSARAQDSGVTVLSPADNPNYWEATIIVNDGLYYPVITCQPWIWTEFWKGLDALPGFPTATDALNWVSARIGNIIGVPYIPIPTASP